MRRLTTILSLALAAVSIAGTTFVTTAWAEAPALVNSKLEALTKNKFTFKGKEAVLETVGGTKLTCTSDEGSGTMTSLSKGEEKGTLKGCEAFAFKCNTEGGKAGEISATFTINVVWVSREEGKIALLLALPEKGLELTCGGLVKDKVKGSFLEPIATAEKAETKYTLTSKQTKGKQEPLEYESEKVKEEEEWEVEVVKDTLESENTSTKKLEETGASGTSEVTFEEGAKAISSECPDLRDGSDVALCQGLIERDGIYPLIGKLEENAELEGKGIKVVCKKGPISGEFWDPFFSKTLSLQSLVVALGECSVSEPANCELEGKSLELGKLEGTFTGSNATETTLKGTWGKLVMKSSGGTCSLGGSYNLTGEQLCTLPLNGEESNAHKMTCSTTGSKLKIEGVAAKLKLPTVINRGNFSRFSIQLS